MRDLVARLGRLDIDVIQPGKRFEHRERCLYHLNRLASQLALKRTGENGLPISVELIDSVMLHLPVRESSSEMSSANLRPPPASSPDPFTKRWTCLLRLHSRLLLWASLIPL